MQLKPRKLHDIQNLASTLILLNNIAKYVKRTKPYFSNLENDLV